MKGDKISQEDNIARLCRPKYVAPDGQIQAGAFMLRAGEESLSINWLEILNCSSRANEIAEVRRIYALKFSVGAMAKIALLNVGEVRQKVLIESLDKRELEILHDPETEDPSHGGIYNLKPDEELIAELILEVVCEVYSARN